MSSSMSSAARSVHLWGLAAKISSGAMTMKILVVDGWTEDGNAEHVRAGCDLQCHVFRDLILETLPNASVKIVNTNNVVPHIGAAPYDALVWTGSGSNIYQTTDHNWRQLTLCERLLDEIPLIWGSCWGLQVIVTTLGGEIAKATHPEVGVARKIRRRKSNYADALYRSKPDVFDAPTHHFDTVTALPTVFDIIAENDITLQTIVSKDQRIVCTQYHPELPYNFIARLMEHWSPDYEDLFSRQKFRARLRMLREKERTECDMRKIEFQNWLKDIDAKRS